MEILEKLKNKIENIDSPYDSLVRVNITQYEIKLLLEMVESSTLYKDNIKENLYNSLYNKFSVVPKNPINKQASIIEANEIRIKKTKHKIEQAIDYIKRNNLKLNQANVSKISGCSVNTVRKYKYLF
jgi:hypothetical protein